MGELADKIRAKYPGVYDSLQDGDLEAKVIAKYPGVYDHLAGSTDSVQGKPDASPAETERMRRQFVAAEGTLPTRAKEFIKSAFDPTQATPRADSLSDLATRVVPESLTKLIPRVGMAAYQAVKGQTDPMVKSLSSLQPIGLPGREMEANAGQSVTGLAQAMTAPTGLMGLDTAKEAWLTDPAGSALAAIPTIRLAKIAPKALPLETIAKVTGKTANKLTDMTLKQPTTLKPGMRDQNVKTAQEGNFIPNTKGVARLNDAIAETEKALADGIASGDAAQVKGTLKRAIDNVESLREKANRSSDPVKNNELIDAEIDRLQNHPLLDKKGEIDIGTMQKMKVEQGREIQKSYGEQKPQFQNDIDKARVRGMKEELETSLDIAFPELSATNQKLGAYYSLKKSLERAANRIENNQGIGIGAPIKAGSGAAIGGMMGGPTGAAIGGGIGTLVGIIEHPAVAPRLAQQLYKASKGAMTYKQALKATQQRLADMAFVGANLRSNKKETTP